MSEQAPRANKELGQHYLKDKSVIEKIVTDFSSEAQAIIEVGPGPATLTRDLAALGLPFYVVERDERFLPLLGEFLKAEQIVHADALAIDWEEFISTREDLRGKKVWLVSNLPYNISAPLTINFVKSGAITFMSLMYQLEVGRKIAPTQGESNTMNSLLALCQTYYQVKSLCKVAPGAFSPPPQVQSVVLSFSRIEAPRFELSQWRELEKFLRLAFSQKRKQLAGVLKASYALSRIKECLEELNLPATVRSEALSLEQIQSLYAKLVLR